MTEPIAKASIEVNADISGVRAGIEAAKAEIIALGEEATAKSTAAKAAVDAVQNGTNAVAQTVVESTKKTVKDATQGAKAEVEDLGRESERTADRIDKANEGSIRGFRRMSGAIRSTIGAFTGLIGVVALLIRSQDRLNELFGDGADRANAFSASLGFATKLEDAQKRASGLADELASVNAKISYWKTLNSELGVIGENSGIIQGRIRSLGEEAASLSGSLGSVNSQIERLREQSKEQLKLIDERNIRNARQSLRDLSNDVRLSMLEGEEEIVARTAESIRKAYDTIGNARLTDENANRDLQAYIEFLRKKEALDLEAMRKRLAEEEAAELEKAAEVAKRYEEAMTAAFQRAADALKFSLGDTFGDTGALVRALNETARAVRERGRI